MQPLKLIDKGINISDFPVDIMIGFVRFSTNRFVLDQYHSVAMYLEIKVYEKASMRI